MRARGRSPNDAGSKPVRPARARWATRIDRRIERRLRGRASARHAEHAEAKQQNENAFHVDAVHADSDWRLRMRHCAGWRLNACLTGRFGWCGAIARPLHFRHSLCKNI
ncbi:hypothetical protein D8O27_09380 [Burkholderia mallei]|uniref:Uncharacterized protein n=3 Tax=pseudomallei group TaxID=111527 RepID=A0AAX1XC90_BURML|nr:hypothetical protein BMAA0936 [Burkholderia mallei ATCC 23344]AUL60739.1 hypothetical protein BHT10_34975 [Burkholderia pseudomallei]PNW97268.1 hypothetical protein CF649_27725 [Burkholderia sp. 136(2017)]PNX09361.1 hypothetical protein CF650_36675 [Burkholderia sp. 129]PNX22372.1 hypothetical protein CF647_36515 [Burkholderia sp. 117]PNX34464.1 hypothetical protein CF648_27730 [Burkholderia sp. 137]RKN99857.1 hypothetical protein D8O31_09105 [Burkholderia mallei]